MRFLTFLIAALYLASPALGGERCEPVECRRQLSLAVPVERVRAPSSELAGVWSMGGETSGLSAWALCLFDDRTYMSIEMNDAFETIVDMGSWSETEGLLQLSPDPAVTWPAVSDRKWVWIRPQEYDDVRWLVGLDVGMHMFDVFGADEEALHSIAFRRTKLWQEGESARAKTDLLRTAWRPTQMQNRAGR